MKCHLKIRRQFAGNVKTYFLEKNKKIYLKETICLKYQNLFSGQNKETIISLSSAELAQRVMKVKYEKKKKQQQKKNKKKQKTLHVLTKLIARYILGISMKRA